MDLSNNYIFIPNPYFKEEHTSVDDEIKRLNKSLRRYLKNTFEIDITNVGK